MIRFLEQECLRNREQAEKSFDFISHPLWRTYVFCYAGGEDLLSRWCADAGDLDAQRQRFFRLLTEQLTPSGIATAIATSAPAGQPSSFSSASSPTNRHI